MTDDLKKIKKEYGEDMMHLCRELFPTLLDTPGLLYETLSSFFAPSKLLYDDIEEVKLEFRDFILFQALNKEPEILITDKTSKDLLSEAGYDLYQCFSEEDIQSFKKYYHTSEELCTFDGDRLDSCYVFFAVKKDVENIKRENFSSPRRQDEYGTSVISIQFSRDENHYLSIKNRYNHRVKNSDATFGNNLENIIPGLTDSFERVYGMKQSHLNTDFELDDYIVANDGKYYKYNYEINNIYYCPNNIIIDNGNVIHLQKERYIVLDYFILDKKEKSIEIYDRNLEYYYQNDTFFNQFEQYIIKGIKETVEGKIRKIVISIESKEDIVIIVDQNNRMISYQNDNLTHIDDYFLYYNRYLKSISLANVESIGNNFLWGNEELESIYLPSLKSVGLNPLKCNEYISINNGNCTNKHTK